MPSNPVDPSSIFHEAINKPRGMERSSYLDEACRGDDNLRRLVEELLAIHEKRLESTLGKRIGHLEPQLEVTQEQTVVRDDGQASVTAEGNDETRQSGQPLNHPDIIGGRYLLRNVLGEGGMGTVYLADQTEPVKRQVAIKLIKRGMDSRAFVARFNAERQALALMDHPGIAKVFDGGITAERQPFFVMELVKGEPITRYCDRHRLPVHARLELFVGVCQAVQHAHQKGIIHRDLKPGNVLVTEVDGKPTPKIIDFGVAKATEQKLTDMSLDDAEAIVGTPAYMSPEQADPMSIDIDTRTDVYSLGVILYELLVGSPPLDSKQFKKGAILEMLRMVREVEPPRPSTRLSTADNLPDLAAKRSVDPGNFAKSLRGEIDWVVMKAIEKDRTRRYDTATGLAQDIQRYLSNEMVEARPPSTGYRFKKFVSRHQGQVIAVSLIAFSLIGGIIGTSLAMFEARRQKADAVAGWGRAETEQKRAEESFATARALILDMGSQITHAEVQKFDINESERGRQRALDKARKQFDQFRASRPDDADLLAQAATLHRYAATASRNMSDFPAATAAISSAIQILEELASRFPDNARFSFDLAYALFDQAGIERLSGKLNESIVTLNQALKIAESQSGKLKGWADRRTLGVIELSLAESTDLLGQFHDSFAHAQRAIDYMKSVSAEPEQSRNIYDPLWAAMAVNQQAMMHRELGDLAEAWKAHEDSLTQMRTLLGPDANRDFLFTDCQLRLDRAETACVIPEQREAALADLLEVIRIIEKMVADYPEMFSYRRARFCLSSSRRTAQVTRSASARSRRIEQVACRFTSSIGTP